MPDETPNTPASPTAVSGATPPTPAPAPAPAPGTPIPGTSTTFNVNLPAGTPATPVPAPATSTISTTPAVIPLTNEQFQEFVNDRARLRQMELDQQARERAAQQAEIDHKMKLGQAEAALQLSRDQAQKEADALKSENAQTQSRAKRYALEGELARALASQPLVPGGAQQLTTLWRDQFNVQAEGDTFAVRTPAFQTVGDFVAQHLALPEYAHFVRAQNPGGGTGGHLGGSQTVPTPAATSQATPGPVINNLGDALSANLLAAGVGQYGNSLEKSQGFGIKRVG